MTATEVQSPEPTEAAPPAVPRADTPDGWSRRDLLAVAAISAAALVLRILHLQQIQLNDPFFEIPSVDGRLYHDWAQRMIAGEGLGDRVLILGPLYPMFMAAVYAVAGPSVASLKAVQCTLGALDCALVYVLAREFFDRRVATVAALGTAVYGMLIFYGGTVMIVNLQVPLVLLTLIASVRTLRSPTAPRWLLVGLLVGISALARQTLLLFAPLLSIWAAIALRDSVPVPRRALMIALFAAGVMLPILPVTMHNHRVGDDFVLLNSTAGANLYMGNNPRATGIWSPPAFGSFRADSPESMRTLFTETAEKQLGRRLAPSEVSSFWTRRALDFVVGQPLTWIRLEGRKLLHFLNRQEVWNNRSYTVSRDFSWLLGLPLLGFGLVAPLAAAGLALATPRWRELMPLSLLLASYLGSALIFFVLSRYRMPMAPVLIVLAAYAVVRLWDAARDGERAAAMRALPVLAAMFFVVHLDLGSENLYMAYYNLGNKQRDLGRWDDAIESYHKSLAINPGYISSHNNLAIAYEGHGQKDAEAIESWRRVLELAERRGDAARVERAQRHLAALEAAP